MIISKIIGGLGNQMFQYAAGRSLSLRLGMRHLVDLSSFDKYKIHQGFELKNVFDCQVNIASEAECMELLGWQRNLNVQRILSKPVASIFRRSSFVFEPNYNYWPDFEMINRSCYLSGYWQSWRYFRNCENIIRRDFTFVQHSDAIFEKTKNLILGGESISLHVRRGDYVENLKAQNKHGSSTLAYYNEAIENMAKGLSQPIFFIFSDDPGWAFDNIKMKYSCHYINDNFGNASFKDMQLMSLCRHHIIANSTFSWWGAWLNANPHKRVIAPLKWFANAQHVPDLFPDSWIVS
jgi:hypothetical protein